MTCFFVGNPGSNPIVGAGKYPAKGGPTVNRAIPPASYLDYA